MQNIKKITFQTTSEEVYKNLVKDLDEFKEVINTVEGMGSVEETEDEITVTINGFPKDFEEEE